MSFASRVIVASALIASSCTGEATPPVQGLADRPLAIFADGGSEWAAAISSATARLVESCVNAEGFSLPQRPMAIPADPDLLSRPFGVTDMDEARSRGYHGPELPTLPPDVYEAYYATLGPSELERLTELMFGADQAERITTVRLPSGEQAQVNGNAFGGCVKRAREQIYQDDIEFQVLQDLVEAIASDAHGRALADSRVIDALSRWTACMTQKSYPAPSPSVAAEIYFEPGQEPTDKEVAAAIADVQCKDEVDLVQVYREIRNGHEAGLLAENPGLIERFRELSESSLETARQVLANG